MDAQLQEFTGTIERILFANDQNGYAVCLLAIERQQPVVVTGTLAYLHPGEQISVSGQWKTHPKFGTQLEVVSCKVHVPTSIVGLKKYLSSGLIKGIGPSYAQKLIDAFGSQVLEIIDKKPERLRTVDGIGPKRAEQIMKGWEDQKEISSIMVFLQDKGITPAYAIKMYKLYGAMTIAVVQENPYRLAQEIWGIGFAIADKIAQAIGIAPDAIQRVKAALLHVISQDAGFGNLYIDLSDLKEKTAVLLGLGADIQEKKLKIALHELYDQHAIALVTHDQRHYVTLASHYATEKGVSELIRNLLKQQSILDLNLDAIYNKLRITSNGPIALNEDQQRGIMNSLAHKITIITGGPGTGKTTLIKQLITILDEHKISYALTSPTGRAAKRMSESTGKQAATVHRLLEFDFVSRAFARNEKNALACQMLIVDEASMLDIFLAHALLKAISFDAHVLFIGDVDQLPSVGAGNFLNDLIASEQVPYIRLTHIFRQAQDSLIITNAHRVNNGEFPLGYLQGAQRDFIFIKEENPGVVMNHIQELLLKRLPIHGISPHHVTVLVPMNRGVVGTHAINNALQTIVNADSSDHLIAHGVTFKVGDRVMQIKNNYDKIIFNGDCGEIESIDSAERIIRVRYQERTIEYESSELDELVLAYAISIHKSQGSEYPAVIIPIFMQHYTLLQRNLLYTAITRAKKLCILLGQPKAIGMAISNNKGLERITFLKHYVTTDLQCR